MRITDVLLALVCTPPSNSKPGDENPHSAILAFQTRYRTHPQRHLAPVGADAQGTDHRVAGEVEPVDEHDQPALMLERAGAELLQPLRGRSDGATTDRVLRDARALFDELHPDQLEHTSVAATRKTRDGRPALGGSMPAVAVLVRGDRVAGLNGCDRVGVAVEELPVAAFAAVDAGHT